MKYMLQSVCVGWASVALVACQGEPQDNRIVNMTQVVSTIADLTLPGPSEDGTVFVMVVPSARTAQQAAVRDALLGGVSLRTWPALELVPSQIEREDIHLPYRDDTDFTTALRLRPSAPLVPAWYLVTAQGADRREERPPYSLNGDYELGPTERGARIFTGTVPLVYASMTTGVIDAEGHRATGVGFELMTGGMEAFSHEIIPPGDVIRVWVDGAAWPCRTTIPDDVVIGFEYQPYLWVRCDEIPAGSRVRAELHPAISVVFSAGGLMEDRLFERQHLFPYAFYVDGGLSMNTVFETVYDGVSATSRVPNFDVDDSFFVDTTEWYRGTIAPLIARREAALAEREGQ